MTSANNTSSLPKLDVFATPYQDWEERSPTDTEMLESGNPYPVKVSLKASIDTGLDAAKHVLGDFDDNGLSNHVEDVLRSSSVLNDWLRAMPSQTPKALSKYQRSYSNSDADDVADDIARHGALLSSGQVLFHGGSWSDFPDITSLPLSTSLCPQVARQNALHQGKAYDADRLDLLVLTVQIPQTKAFVFKQKGTTLGHECEVLLAPGARLSLMHEHLVQSDFEVHSVDGRSKPIPLYVMEVAVS